jgi:thiamine pyrophosphokinase
MPGKQQDFETIPLSITENHSMHWILFANGSLVPTPKIEDLVRRADRLAGVDGGSRHLQALGLIPHLAVGDMDSIPPELLSRYHQDGVELHQHPPRKDATDLELALELALARGATRITILGGTGGRLDHTLGNLFLLAHCLPTGIPVCIMDQAQRVHLVDKTLHIEGEIGDTLSLLPATPLVTGVTLSGLEYPLLEASLEFGTSRAMCNVFAARLATVTVRSGRLFVFHLDRT